METNRRIVIPKAQTPGSTKEEVRPDRKRAAPSAPLADSPHEKTWHQCRRCAFDGLH